MYSSIPSVKTPISIQARARAHLELAARGVVDVSPFATYQFTPAAYIKNVLGWQPWSGSDDAPGQQQILDVYTRALLQQHERQKYDRGESYDATVWQPGQTIQNRIRVEAGHTVGKTKISSGIVSHFLDCFTPSIIYTFAPTWDQVKKLLWKEIKIDRTKANLAGRMLETCEIIIAANHFAQGKATSNAGGTGTERVQGQHGEYLLFVLDEAEGVADYVYDAIDSMASGGIVIVLLIANPRTRTSRFHKQASYANVVSLRMSCLHHPNVIEGREIIPGAVRRDYVVDMLEKHCEIVATHNADNHTFTVPWQPDAIYTPDREFLFRVLGIAPANSTANTFVPTGRYEAALKRRYTAPTANAHKARIGVDVARYGDDSGAVYVATDTRLFKAATIDKQDTYVYVAAIHAACAALAPSVSSVHIRVDGTGGYGSGIIDRLLIDTDLRSRFRDFRVIEVQFGASAYNRTKYADCVTEMYAEAAEALREIALDRVPSALEIDLTERRYSFESRGANEVKKLEAKDHFKKRNGGRSPDDGDGCVLALAPDYLFIIPVANSAAGGSRQGAF